MLHRRTRLGSLGYVTKGPVLASEESSAVEACRSALEKTTVRLSLRALVVQPPDASALEEPLRESGFQHASLLRVDDANLFVDLDDELEQRMAAGTRKRVRQAARRGVTVREGSGDELGTFYSLMATTCERRGVKPNPSESGLRDIWRLFEAEADVRLLFAEFDGETVAGQLCLGWGGSLTLWKKGWSGAAADARPNYALCHETLVRAREAGYRTCNFAGLERSIAEALLAGNPLSSEQQAGADLFNVGFAGRPVLLPRALIWLPKRWGRAAHGLVARNQRLKAKVQHWVAGA